MLRVNTLSGFGRIVPAAGGGGDADVAAFISATGIADSTIENALEALVTSLKADGIWAKCIAIYPFVGGDATKHSYNLKNTAAYQITWNGTVTHNSNGITGNGSTGYGNTGLAANVAFTASDGHLSVYSRTDASGNLVDIGAKDGGDEAYTHMMLRLATGQFDSFFFNNGNRVRVAQTGSQGFYIASRRSTTDFECYRNGSSIGSSTVSTGASGPSSYNIFIGARSENGSPQLYSSRNLAFASIGSGLTDTEAADFHTAVEAFQDALSRGVV